MTTKITNILAHKISWSDMVIYLFVSTLKVIEKIFYLQKYNPTINENYMQWLTILFDYILSYMFCVF